MVVEALNGAELIVAVLVIISIVGGSFVWLVKRSKLLATEPYVEQEVDDIREKLGEMENTVEENKREMEELRALIEGGNTKWEDGVLDYLQRNIERVDDISEDIDEIQMHLSDMDDSVDED